MASRPLTFACVRCRIVLNDGVDYSWCPRCDGEVVRFDGRRHLWLCEGCKLPQLGDSTVQPCRLCGGARVLLTEPLAAAGPPTTPRPRPTLPTPGSAAWTLLQLLLVVQAIFALLDPDGFPYLWLWLAILQITAVVVVALVVILTPEVRRLARYHTTRVIHGLEHAAAKLLEERGFAVVGGQTFHGMFELYLPHAGGEQFEHLETAVHDATTDAITRIRFGERALAFHERCGTSLAVGVALLAFAIVGAGVIAIALAMPLGIAFALTVAAAILARLVARRAGLLAQRWLTVSTEFASAKVTLVEKRVSADGKTVTAIVLVDVVPRAIDVAAVAV